MTDRTDPRSVTLGDVVYGAAGAATAPEHDWLALVRALAAGEGRALDALYERMAAPVFTLVSRMLSAREAAEELTVDVFHEAWRRAPRYDARTGPVIAWIMNVARSRAVERRLWLESRAGAHESGAEPHTKADGEASDRIQQERTLRTALSVLTPDERLTIETVLFAATSGLPLGAAKARIHSALGKLKLILQHGGDRASAPAGRCERADSLPEYVLRTLPTDAALAVERHAADCVHCRREIDELRRVVDALSAWGTDLLRPPQSLRWRVAGRIAAETGSERISAAAQPEPPWQQVTPGIQVKVLSADAQTDRMSMLVRLAPGFAYPSHRHADVEELWLLDGELWIDGRRLVPGDYNRAEPGTADQLVWSGTGCTCVLATSANDVLH